jgi:hypothetical protein
MKMMMKNFMAVMAVMTMMLFAQLACATVAPVDAKEQKLANKLHETQVTLGIKPDQQAAWDGYKNAVMDRAKVLSDEKMKMRASREGAAANAPKVKGQPKAYANTAMDRLNQQINYEKLNLKTLEDLKPALDNLYKALTPEQKQLADKTLKIK